MSDWYDAPDEPALAEFGPVQGLSVSGRGEPGGAEHAAATQALYAVVGSLLGLGAGVAWTEERRERSDRSDEGRRRHGGPEARASGASAIKRGPAAPPPLEGRWWVEDERPALAVPREEWRWHLFMRLPDPAHSAAAARLPIAGLPPAAARVQLTTFDEGWVVHVMHHGPFADEPRTLARMEAYLDEHGLVAGGLHHEIYLSDPFGTEPARMRTILRQPVRPAI
jgi:hypothetical protein